MGLRPAKPHEKRRVVGKRMWRTHSACRIETRLDARRPTRRGVELRLDAARKSACATAVYAVCSGKSPGIQRAARAAGKARRKAARELSEVSTPRSASRETMRRA